MAETCKTCETCRFWDTSIFLDHGYEGMCRARAPFVDDRTGRALWPFTEPNGWCGEHQPATRNRKDG